VAQLDHAFADRGDARSGQGSRSLRGPDYPGATAPVQRRPKRNAPDEPSGSSSARLSLFVEDCFLTHRATGRQIFFFAFFFAFFLAAM
jgi:hypothetical protein